MMPEDFSKEREELARIGNFAVRKAQEENLKKGIPNVYSKNGTMYFQLPDLSITTENPFLKQP